MDEEQSLMEDVGQTKTCEMKNIDGCRTENNIFDEGQKMRKGRRKILEMGDERRTHETEEKRMG